MLPLIYSVADEEERSFKLFIFQRSLNPNKKRRVMGHKRRLLRKFSLINRTNPRQRST